MSLFQGIGAASGILQGAASLVRELKQPAQQDGAAFQALLREQANPVDQKSQALARVQAQTAEFIQLRDLNQDGRLRLDESGLSREVFAQLDTDQDGVLSAEELSAPARAAVAKQYGASQES